jgi:hypothetical protein
VIGQAGTRAGLRDVLRARPVSVTTLRFTGVVMGEQTTISIPSDSQGFLSRKCPACSKLFKIKLGEGSDEPLSHCPYCDARGDDWFTDEQRAYVRAVGLNFARDVVSEQLGDMARRLNRGASGGGFITAKMTHKSSPRQPVPPVLIESDQPMSVVFFECCKESVKHDGSSDSLHCIICGAEAHPELRR